ncbi:hypothetical protein ACHHYP_13864 [Achlya hypogyna]|uniref:Jacalin-type lectin domain-containing protein n=1 Tax=Achlya hypogyna TaxID=1202772 RepID=A0A1V9YEJ7_ACHHY|nr:hypothetical protein ACHHYP_13864 [Achlya hypogyna]
MEDDATQKRHEATRAKLEAQYPIPKWYDLSLPHLASPTEAPKNTRPMGTSYLASPSAVAKQAQAQYAARQHTANDAFRSPTRLNRRKVQTAAASTPMMPRRLEQINDFGLWPFEPTAPKSTEAPMSSYDMENILRARESTIVDDRWAPLEELRKAPKLRSSPTFSRHSSLAKSGRILASSYTSNNLSHIADHERHRTSHVWSHVSQSIDEIHDTAVAALHSTNTDEMDDPPTDLGLDAAPAISFAPEAEVINDAPSNPSEDNNADEVKESTRRIQTPGLRRRENIRKLVHFADGHLRKKIFRGWSAIEVAFSGGDLSQAQVEKVLATNNICVTRLDLERVHTTIEEFFSRTTRTSRSARSIDTATIDTETVRVSVEPAKPHTVSYELMMDLFYPHDEAEATLWLLEMEEERQAQLHEDDVRRRKLLELENKIKRRLAESAQDMWRVLKQFDYMRTSWPSLAVRDATTARFHELLFESQRRKKHLVPLDSSTGDVAPQELDVDEPLATKHAIGYVFKALLQSFSRNRCLEDLELDEAAHVFHDIAATVLQKGAVAFLERRAIFDCPERQAFLAHKLQKRLFRLWRANAVVSIARRGMLLRKFVAWKYLMVCGKWYRELFRVCFWPLYVWKRWTQFVIISRAKAIFLRHVFDTYYLLRHTRAWRAFVVAKQALLAELARRKQERDTRTLKTILDKWRPWAAYGQRIRKIWQKSGLCLQFQTKYYTTKMALYLWRYFAILHRDMARRQYLCIHGMLVRHRQKDAPADENDAVPLTRIMDSPMGHKIKHKTRLHDLCITMYIKYRKKNRLNILAMALVFKRIAPGIFEGLWRYKERKKRNRLVTSFGVFCVLRERFLAWLRVAMIQKQRARQYGLQRGQPVPLPDEPSTRAVGRALQWRQDKEWRDQGLQEATSEAVALREAIQALRIARDESHVRFLDREDEIRDIRLAEKRIQDDEQGKTLQMTSQLHHYANQIIHTRVRKLYEVICRAFDIFEDQAREYLLKSTFRALRVPAVMRKMTVLCHRCQIRNWLRIAKRYAYWLHNIPRYHRLKQMYFVWQAWAKFIRQRQLFESPGLATKMKRRRVLVSKFEKYLLQEDFMLIPTVLGQKLSFNSFRAVFTRWVEWTQLHIGFTALLSTFHQRMQVRTMGRIFLAWKHSIKARYIELPASWLEHRHAADVERLRSSLWSLRKRLVSWRARKVLRACDRILKLSVCSNPTLKNLFAAHTKEALRRLALENRLMFVAYNERRLHHYEERQTPMYGGIKGNKFEYEEAIPFGHVYQVIVVCGKSVDGLATVVKSFSTTTEGRLCGNPFGTRSVFQLAPHELLVKVEGYASQSTLLGLRFGTNHDRYSKWYGRADVGVYFALEAGPEEEIIGFHGYAGKDSVHGIGAVFRRTTERNIFEGLWTKADETPSEDSINQCDRQFAYFLQMRSCDIYAAMERAHRLALRIWRSESTHEAVNRLRIVMGICQWFFNSLTHGLVKLSENEDEGQRILQEGINIRASGERLLMEGEKIMEMVSRYRDGRKQQLNVAVLGFKKIQELRQNIEIGDYKIKRGKQLIAEGNTVILAGRQMLPKIPLTDRMLKNVRELYRIVLTKDSMDSMSDGIRKLLLMEKEPDTSFIDMKDVAEARANAAFDMGQARAEVVSSNLREKLTKYQGTH